MPLRIAIIGTGPTGIYTLAGLVDRSLPCSITLFEVEAVAGRGTPYHPDVNDRTMLANIASVELPPVREALVAWLRRQSDEELFRLGIVRDAIKEREFYPRIVLGEYFHDQFRQLVREATANGHSILVKPNHRVIDIRLRSDDIALRARTSAGEENDYAYDHVVMATGHNWPESTEVKPGYFISPWPAPTLKSIPPCRVGILGTSLSAIDALMNVVTAHGAFHYDVHGKLAYQSTDGAEGLSVTLMSRKGLLPEADFYCEYPYRPLMICTPEAVNEEIRAGSTALLDRTFALFARELAACDPDYAAGIGLANLTTDTFADAYFADRNGADPFVWAALNLAEAEHNKAERRTVEWRYAILRMHEIVAKVVPHLDAADLKRFHRKLKSVFIDDYATVPHLSIQRILALHRAGCLTIARLGSDYALETHHVARGAIIRMVDEAHKFGAFIDATGQSSLSARDLPFPSLIEQGVVKAATTLVSAVEADFSEAEFERTGGIELDEAFRPISAQPVVRNLYCAAIPLLLHKMPFVQGLTSAKEIGDIVARTIKGQESATTGTLILAE